MSQFIDTNHANEAAREAFQGYRKDTERIKQILQNGESVSNEDTKPMLSAGFFEELGFYETSPQPLYKLPLPTVGTYLLATNEGSLWMEYDEGNGEHYKQSVGFGKFTEQDIISLVSVLQTCR